MNLPEKVYTETDLKDARTKGKAIGWLQGGGIVLAGTLLWKFLSWIPVVLGGGPGAAGHGDTACAHQLSHAECF